MLSLSVGLSACLPICFLLLCLSVCLSVCLYVCLFVCLSVCLFVCLPASYRCVCLPGCFLLLCLSVCLPVCFLLLSLYACLSASLCSVHSSVTICVYTHTHTLIVTLYCTCGCDEIKGTQDSKFCPFRAESLHDSRFQLSLASLSLLRDRIRPTGEHYETRSDVKTRLSVYLSFGRKM